MDRESRVAIVGVGLIGGSIGLALRGRVPGVHVTGIGRDAGRLKEACEGGILHAATTDLAEGVAGADVVVVCTPVTRIAEDVCAAARHAPEGVLLTDAGSTKRSLVEAIEGDSLARRGFVAAHPIAGSERKGAAHARADLFEGRTCVLTPTSRTVPGRLERARRFWGSLGCRLVQMDPAEHDRALAWTSHLPHAVAAAMAAAVSPELLPLAAGAYRDVTRVAGSDADLWTGIFLANQEPTLEALDAYLAQLDTFRKALARGDAEALRAWWHVAKAHRLQYDSLSMEHR